MTQRHPRLRLEELAPRILPSISPVAPLAHAAHVGPASMAPSPAAHHFLAGKGHGHYSYDAVQSGAGTEYRLHQGGANLWGMGEVTVSGSVHSVGFISEGRAWGELTFANARGSVTVELQGPVQPGFSALPETFNYHVVKATGAYAHKSGSGSLSLLLKAEPLTPGAMSNGASPHGSFTLSI